MLIDTPPPPTARPSIDIAIDYRYRSGEEQDFLMKELASERRRAHRGDSPAKRTSRNQATSEAIHQTTDREKDEDEF